MEARPIDLYEFLVEAELQQYYNSIKVELKIATVLHLKYASDEDLKQIGLSKPEIRRLRKFYEKYYPHGYLSKIKRLLQNPTRRDDVTTINPASSTETLKTTNSPSKLPNNKHIIPADSICVNKQLGVGEFGIVQQGVWTNGNERIQVAIKCLCRERMQSNPMEFLKEAAIMHSIEHENIVRLYGVVLDTDSLMLVTELAHLRSLLECLKDSGLRVSFLTVPTLCEFAMQICSGMMYLENKRLIHRDLAARNILVFSKNKVKISDFGLSRALGVGKDYYQTNFNVNLKLPIAWCAPECINFLRFTNASDVWAYGVCLWEMFSYGFQPWAALTGGQILEAIDEPHYQRLESPECCPKEYYTLMLKCWQHDPGKRPKFSEIYTMLPDMKPEQLKAITSINDARKEHLLYRQNDIITVLDKPANSTYWKGVLNSGKTGIFNPSNTVAYLGNSLPSSINRDSFCRGSERNSSKRKLCPEMISGPQNDLKHTGHVGLDGAYFGDVAFLSSSSNSQSYNHVPKQIVTPYKPSEDIEQTPLLLPPTPTSPDSLQTASCYFPAQSNDGFVSSFDFTNHNSSAAHGGSVSSLSYPSSNPFANINTTHNKFLGEGSGLDDNFTKDTRQNGTGKRSEGAAASTTETSHEYHEISDDEMPGDKFDLGPSLLDEMYSMFRSMNAANEQGESKSPDFDNVNKKNEMAEFATKFQRKNSSGLLSNTLAGKAKKKSAATVKPISLKDEKILNQAINFANEISARSMTDLVSDSSNSAHSPKRKFSFRFPHGAHSSNSMDRDNAAGNISQPNKNVHGVNKSRNFSEKVTNVPDLQNTITEEYRAAYNSLVDRPIRMNYEIANLKNHLQLSSSMSTLQTGSPKATAVETEQNVPVQKQPVVDDLCMRTLITHAELKVPNQPAPRPNTLPGRNSSNKKMNRDHNDSDTNPLRILRDKNYPIIRPRMKINTNSETVNNGILASDPDEACESPSYLPNPEYTFSECDINIHHSDAQKIICNKEIENLNPIPLPPRDRNKVLLTNVKRHVRKHPLIIPASGLQRTLNKVTTSLDENASFPGCTNGDEIDGNLKASLMSHKKNYNMPRALTKPAEAMKLQAIPNQHSYINQEDINVATKSDEQKVYTKKFIENNFPDKEFRTYENIDTLRLQSDNTDSASLHFESILENDINKITDMSGGDDSNHAFFFDMQRDNYDIPRINNNINESGTQNIELERKKTEFLQKFPNYMQPKNELANNALFNKFRDSAEIDQAMSSSVVDHVDRSHNVGKQEPIDFAELEDATDDSEKMLERKLIDSNSVSCEDLLEFANKKPKGKERGIESDEVRIMTKVLGSVATPEQCLIALDAIEWNVHRAIKIISLQNAIKPTRHISFEECVEALQQYDWDLYTTSIQLNMQQKMPALS